MIGEAFTLFKDFVLEKVNECRTIIGLHPPTDKITLTEFELWKENK